MLTQEQVQEIKEHLERAQNPVFFFDNDNDGLCSFLLLRRFIGRGRGVAIKSFPSLDVSYIRKAEELKADYIFILDKPIVSEDFFKQIRERNIPVVWIDHHEVQVKIPEFVSYYNPLFNNEKTNEPVTALCYQVTNKKEDAWIAIVGCIADVYLPDFYKEFIDDYPELGIKTNNAFEVLYNSKIGDIARLLSNGLKDKTSNVVNMLRFLMNAKSPHDVLEENSKNKSFHKRSVQIYVKYKRLLDKAKLINKKDSKLLFFKYSGDLSVSGELSNELLYSFPNKIIVVAYVKEGKVNISLRGKEIREKFLKAIEGLEGASGGGHKDAVGGVVQTKDLDSFVEKLKGLS